MDIAQRPQPGGDPTGVVRTAIAITKARAQRLVRDSLLRRSRRAVLRQCLCEHVAVCADRGLPAADHPLRA
jgi:hypothetical protein